jgi:uncharacterized protein (UPF0264 family)
VEHAKGQRLLAGVAGSLGAADLAPACLGLPDVVGFRGAACDGGRHGRVAADRVASLRGRLDQVRSSIGPYAQASQRGAWRNAGR